MRISDWSSDVCSSDLAEGLAALKPSFAGLADFDLGGGVTFRKQINRRYPDVDIQHFHHAGNSSGVVDGAAAILLTSKDYADKHGLKPRARSEEHTSELQSLMRISYAVFFLKKKKKKPSNSKQEH